MRKPQVIHNPVNQPLTALHHGAELITFERVYPDRPGFEF